MMKVDNPQKGRIIFILERSASVDEIVDYVGGSGLFFVGVGGG